MENFIGKFINDLSTKAVNRLDEEIKKALKNKGYIVGENITESELGECGLIEVRDGISTLIIFDNPICRWTKQEVITETYPTFKITLEYNFTEL